MAKLNVTEMTRALDSSTARAFASDRGFHSGTVVDDGAAYSLIEVERMNGKAVAQNRTFNSMEEAVKAFGHGPESGKDFPVTIKATSSINSAISATKLAQSVVDRWNAKGLGYPMLGMYPGKGEGNCHSFTHFAAETLRVPHPEKADRASGWYQLNFGWDRGGEIFHGN